MADAENRFREAGINKYWLACAIGNERAARFYEKCGWVRSDTMTFTAETSAGPFTMETWRFEKSLAAET